MKHGYVILLWGFLVMSCSPAPKKPEPTSPLKDKPALMSKAERFKEAAQWFFALSKDCTNTKDYGFSNPLDIELVPLKVEGLTGLRRDKDGLEVHVSGKKFYAGSAVSLSDAPPDSVLGNSTYGLEESLRYRDKAWKPQTLFVALAPEAPYWVMEQLLKLDKKFRADKISFLFKADYAGRALPKAPGPSSIDAELLGIKKVHPADRATWLSKLAERLLQQSPHLKRSFEMIAMAPAEYKCELLCQAIGETLDEKPCDVDLAAVKKLIWVVVVYTDLAVPVTLDLAEAGESETVTIKARRDQTWSEVYQQVLDAAQKKKPVKFVFE